MTAKVTDLQIKSNSRKANFGRAALDTLAQSGTNSEDFAFDLQAETGKEDGKTLKKRARRKYLTNGIITGLVDASRFNENGKLPTKSYWNSHHCAAILTEDIEGKIMGRYCKNRWCMVCNSIRTAQLIKQYKPVFDTWEDVQFVTLTVRSCDAHTLPILLNVMAKDCKKILNKYKKQFQRAQGERFKGFRKLECTYNPYANNFHPHYHFFIQGRVSAERMKSDWLQMHLDDAVEDAQNIRKVDDKAVMELFKYTTKVISGKPGKDGRKIYADALDIIFNAMRGKRTFQPFGFEQNDRSLMQSADESANDAEVTKKQVFAVAEWQFEKWDWVNKETGELLANYDPGEGMKKLVEEKIVVRKGHDWTPLKEREVIIIPF